MNNNGCLVSDSRFKTITDLTETFCMNSRVAFVFAEKSEAAEEFCKHGNVQSSVIVIDAFGKYECKTGTDFINNQNSDVDELALQNKYFSLKVIPKEGDFVKTKDGEVFKIGQAINSGGEGTVYRILENDLYVCKIYREKQMNPLRLNKLMVMEKRPVRYKGICWPEKVVYSVAGEPVGYIMQMAKGKTLSNIFGGEDEVRQNFPKWKRVDLVDAVINIFEKIEYLHLLGVVVGDIRLQNIMIDDDGNTYLIDMDSCQIDNYPCLTGDSDFAPSELHGIEFKKRLRTFDNEIFSASILLFILLFLGLHPYQRINGAETIEEEIRKKAFIYPENLEGDYSQIPKGVYKYIWMATPIQLRDLFIQTFKNGKRACLP